MSNEFVEKRVEMICRAYELKRLKELEASLSRKFQSAQQPGQDTDDAPIGNPQAPKY